MASGENCEAYVVDMERNASCGEPFWVRITNLKDTGTIVLCGLVSELHLLVSFSPTKKLPTMFAPGQYLDVPMKLNREATRLVGEVPSEMIRPLIAKSEEQ